MDPISDDIQRGASDDAAGAQPSDGGQPSKRRASPITPGLYIVSTPIGNLGDLTPRAANILAAANIIACEDTRVTGRLLNLHGIRTRMIAYHDHSSAATRDRIIQHVKDGEIVALVSDAGTPLISDPGYRLVRAAVEAAAAVTAAPGPASPLTALVLSGLPTDRFLFAGYLPPKDKARRDNIAEFAALRATLIFLESPKRLAASLTALADILGNRPAAVARELTKLHEEVRRNGLADLAAHYRDAPAPKGEVVLVVGPPVAVALAAADLDVLIRDAMATMSVRDAAATVAAATGAPRKEVYSRALALARAEGTEGDA